MFHFTNDLYAVCAMPPPVEARPNQVGKQSAFHKHFLSSRAYLAIRVLPWPVTRSSEKFLQQFIFQGWITGIIAKAWGRASWLHLWIAGSVH